MPLLVALKVLGIAKEEWDQLPASKKARIRKAIEEKDFEKARKIYANPCKPAKLRETEHFFYVKVKGKKLKFKKPDWTKERVIKHLKKVKNHE